MPFTVTVQVLPLPLIAETVPVAVPVFVSVKSPVSTPVTDSEKVTV